jgi:putative acetyltransferase
VSDFHTAHLVLREFRDSDVDPLYEIQGNPDYMRFTFCAQSRAACENWLRRYADSRRANGFAPWTIVHNSDNRVIGWGGLNIDPTAPEWGPEVSYFIHPAYQGRGFATELVQCSLRHGFADVGLRRIAAFAMPLNDASIRVLTKCGFKFIRYEPALQRNHYEAIAELENIKVSLERPDSSDALNLIGEAQRELKARYPADSIQHPFDPRDVASPPAVFVIARLDGRAVGCGAVRPLDRAVGEVKRVFVQPESRRIGIARVIMATLEDLALRNGFTTLRLETGTLQPESVALYESLGYRRIPPFGEYVSDPQSLCYEKDLSPKKR